MLSSMATVGLGFDEKWYTDIVSDSVGVFYMTFWTYFQTLWVLKKAKLKGQEPIKVSLAEHTQNKYKIDFKRQLTQSLFHRMGSTDTDDGKTATSGSPRAESPRADSPSHFGKMGRLYFNIINEESSFSLFCLHRMHFISLSLSLTTFQSIILRM